jgi:putative oxidoreductase
MRYYQNFVKAVSLLKDLPLLFMRLILAYGFYMPARNKWADIGAIADWFASMNYPLPTLNAYLAAGTEAAGVVLLTLGLLNRVISIPLIIVMLVAIFTVHAGNGFSAGDNGFEIPLYYMIMLFTILVYGPGKISVDYFTSKAERK